MATQPSELLGDIATIGEKRDFLKHALILQVKLQFGRPQSLPQLIAVDNRHQGRTCSHAFDVATQNFQATEKIN